MLFSAFVLLDPAGLPREPADTFLAAVAADPALGFVMSSGEFPEAVTAVRSLVQLIAIVAMVRVFLRESDQHGVGGRAQTARRPSDTASLTPG